MKNILLILLVTINLCKISSIITINEFEEIEIVNDTQILLFNNDYSEELDYNPEIIINCLNPYFKKDLISKLVISKTNRKSYTLENDGTIILSRNDNTNEGKGEYKLIFKNFIGGKIIIFNSIHSFPLNNFTKFINFYYNSKLDSNFTISLYSDILEEDIYLSIKGRIQDLNIIKINETENEEIYFDNKVTKLNKGCSYNFTYNATENNILFVFFHKIDLITYDNSSYEKYYLIYSDPIYYLVNLKDFNNSVKDLYFYVYQDNYWYSNPKINLEIAEVDEDVKAKDLDSITYKEKKILDRTIISTKFNDSLINSNYILIKITADYYSYLFFHIFENSIEIKKFQTITIDSEKETLLTIPCNDKFTVIISNNTNIKSFNTFEINYFDTKYISTDYPRGETLSVNILPFEKPTSITMFSLHLITKHLNKDFSIQNFLFPYFTHIENSNSIWFFYNNKNSIVNLKKYFGNPKLYYSNNLETLKNYQNKISVLNPIEDEVNIEGPFFIYIYPNENTFVDILINEIDNNEYINFSDDDNVLKFLKKDVRYSFLDIIENNIRLEINQELTKNIKIIDLEENVKITLNKDNPYIDLDESYNDFKIISEEDTYINIYHNIKNVFCNEEIYTIELKKEEIEKGIIINITNIKSIERFNYTIFYGYKNLIPSNLQIIFYTNQYLYINNQFEKFDFLNENKNLYIYIFGTKSIYTIHYINIYKLDPSNFFTKITPKEDYYLLPNKDYNDFYYSHYYYSFSIVELLFCRNDIKEKPVNIEIIDSNGKKQSETITKNNYIISSTLKTMIKFYYDNEFILISHEGWDSPESNIINFYIHEVNENHISLLIKSNLNKDDFNYTIVIIEENEEGEEILNKLNNPCYFIQLLDKDYNLSLEYNNIVTYASSKKDYFIYEKIDISKFKENKNLYVKILCYAENYKTLLYSNAKKIFMENIVQNNNYNDISNEKDFGYDYIYDNKEYSINNNEYIFKYNIKKNYLGVMPVIFLTYYNTHDLNNLQKELEVINPLFHNMTYKLSNYGQITLNNENILNDYGDYYLIFRNCL